MADSSRKGAGPLIPRGTSYRRATVEDLQVQQGWAGDRFPGASDGEGGAPVAPSHDQQLAPPGYLKIIWFKKMHYVSPAVYARDAGHYNDLHWKEAWILINDLDAQDAIYSEWSDPEGFMNHVVSKTVGGWKTVSEDVKGWFGAVKKVPKPDPAEFFDLKMRVYDSIDRMVKTNLDARKVAKDGLDLALVWEDAKRLNEAITKYRDAAIKSAEEVTGGLETVETCSFQILNLVPTLTMMDPIREAIYKISVMMLQAGTRGAGGWIASDSKDYVEKWKSARREILAILKQKVPEMVADIIMIPLNKYLLVSKSPGFQKKVIVVMVRNTIEFVGDYVWILAENNGESLTEDQFDALIRKRLDALVGSILSEIPGLSANMRDTIGKTIVKSVVDNVIRVLWNELLYVRQTMKAGDKTLAEALWADLPTMLMKVVEGSIMGVLQRRAAQTSMMTEQAMRGQERTDLKEAWEMGKQDGLGWVKTRPPREQVADLKKSRSKLPPFKDEEYQSRWRAAKVMTDKDKPPQKDSIHVERETASNLEAYAHNNNAIILFSNPNKWRTMHMENPEALGAKGQKPVYCKGKTADGGEMGENNGLVFKPVEVKDAAGNVKKTHKNMDKARDTWFGVDEKGHRNDTTFYQNGGMIREDGLAFHPDQLKRWGTLKTEKKADCIETVKTLHELQKQGICDLNDPENKTKIDNLVKAGVVTREQVDTMTRTLADAKIGFISDIDVAGVWDAKTGEVIPLGREAKTFSLEDANRQQMNAEVNADNKFENKKLDSDLAKLKGPSKILNGDAYKPLARPGDPHQHGTFAESGYDLFNEVAMVAPNREVFIVRSRLTDAQASEKGQARSQPGDPQWKVTTRGHFLDVKEQVDAFFKERYGLVNSPFDAALNIERELPDQTRVTKKSTSYPKPPKTNTPKIEKVLDMHSSVEIIDEEGLGFAPTEVDVMNSLIHRALRLDDYYVRKFAGDWTYAEAQKRKVVLPAPDALANARLKHHTFVGVDESAANLVIAVIHFGQPLAEAIASLLRTRIAVGPIWPLADDGSERKIWYEIYTAYRPVATDYVRTRLGKPQTGIPGRFDDLKTDGTWMATCFGKPDDKKLTDPKLYAFATGGYRPSYTPSAKRYGQFMGLELQDVWETKTAKLAYRPTKNFDQFFTIFPSAPVDAAGVMGPSKRAIEPKKK